MPAMVKCVACQLLFDRGIVYLYTVTWSYMLLECQLGRITFSSVLQVLDANSW